MTLLNEQADFIEALTSDLHLETIVPNKHMSIYQNNVRCNLTNCLKDAYPLLVKLLGDEFFTMAARKYINQYPSRSGNLHEYGSYFSDFLSEYSPAQSLPYIAEVAVFEWLSHIIYRAADHPPFVTQSLENFNPDQFKRLHFILHPASTLRRFKYPILDIIDLCENNPDKMVDIDKGGVNLLIIRRELDVSLCTLSQADYYFLEAINQNCSLQEALEFTESTGERYSLIEKLPTFIENKIIVDCFLDGG